MAQRFSAFLLAFVLLPFLGGAALADYVQPSWASLVRTMVRFNALSLDDPTLVDEFSIVTECDLYKAFYHDDFKWNQVRQAVRKSVQMNMATFPMNYRYDVDLQLDRYDFAAQIYKFTSKTALNNVNAFQIYSVEGIPCGTQDVKAIPRTFRAVLSTPVFMEGIPLPEKDAQSLLKMMNEENNSDHIVYARFNLRTVYIEPLRRSTKKLGFDTITIYAQSNEARQGYIRFDSRLDSIEFYADPKRTRLIYQFQG